MLFAFIKESKDSACIKSILLFKSAALVNSPASACLTPRSNSSFETVSIIIGLPSGESISNIITDIDHNKLMGIMLSCVSPENFELNLEEIKKLKVPFGFKLNAFIKTNPKPNYNNAYKKSKTGNPNEFLGVRKDLTPSKMFEFAKKFKNAGATIIGGCCEIKPSHIEAFSKLK